MTRTKFDLFPAKLVVFITFVYVFSEWVWKFGFLGGFFSGVYWLFAFLDATVMPLAGLFLASAIPVGLINGLIQSNRIKGSPILWGKLGLALLISSFALGTVFPGLMGHHTVHMDSIRTDNHVYYLAAYPLFDINYGLFECDKIGLVCHRIYMSGDIIGSEDWPGRLIISADNKELNVIMGASTNILKYPLP